MLFLVVMHGLISFLHLLHTCETFWADHIQFIEAAKRDRMHWYLERPTAQAKQRDHPGARGPDENRS